jgi:NADPH-dependent 2,4-dienoyl-CoA reductase/sulfur reductase-like enzyme
MRGVTLNTLVDAALSGRPYNQARLGDQAKRYARKIAARACRDLPDDLHDEIAQQAIVELFETGASALAGSTGQALFRRAVFCAIRVVRSDYAAPGQRTRRPAKAAAVKLARVAAEQVERIADAHALERATVGGPEGVHLEFDLFESAAAALEVRGAEDRVELDWSLRTAPPSVAAALRLVCVRGETLSFAADDVGLSRFSLSRRLDAFCPRWRDAA